MKPRLYFCNCHCSITESRLTLCPHELQHARLPCPSLSPRICSNSCSLSRRCFPTISLSLIPICSCRQSFPASGSFPVSHLFVSGVQSIRASASAPVLPMNIQGWFPLGLTGLISLQSKELSRVLQHHSSKASILGHSAFFMVQFLHPHMLLLLLLSHFSRVRLCVAPKMAAHQALLSLGFSRQKYWSGLPFPPMHESEKWK